MVKIGDIVRLTGSQWGNFSPATGTHHVIVELDDEGPVFHADGKTWHVYLRPRDESEMDWAGVIVESATQALDKFAQNYPSVYRRFTTPPLEVGDIVGAGVVVDVTYLGRNSRELPQVIESGTPAEQNTEVLWIDAA